MPSFFMLLVFLLVLVQSIDIYNYVYWFLSISVIYSLALHSIKKNIVFNALTILVAIFIALLVLNMMFIRPVDNAEASYLIWLFAGSFILFASVNENTINNLLYLLVIIFVSLSIWGVIQYTTGYAYLMNMGSRANGIFVTPNTFAASINIILLPVIVLYLCSEKVNRYIFPSVLIMFSGLLVTQSRGGWIAFIVSLILLFILIKYLRIKVSGLKLKKLAIGLMLVLFVYVTFNYFSFDRSSSDYAGNLNHIIRSENIVTTMSQRFELYDIAWKNIKNNYLSGYGFHTFENYKPRYQTAFVTGNVTRFVHNDYLQLWMETGILGPVLFLAFFIFLLYFTIVLSGKVSSREKMILLSIVIGISTFYLHALVDFLFYVPFLLMMFACYLGLFNRIINRYQPYEFVIELNSRFINFSFLKVLVCLIILISLSKPAIGQWAFNKAVARVNDLDIVNAISSFELARRFSPDEADYYWYEGAVLMNAVRASKHKPSAIKADQLFLTGMSINIFSANNRLARAELHRDFRILLDKPENLKKVLSWVEDALYWSPNDPIIRAEYVKTLIAMGNNDKANKLLENYLLSTPNSEELLGVKASLKNNL